MRRVLWCATAAALALAAEAAAQAYKPPTAAAAQTPAATKTPVLLVTGVDLHKWRETTPLLAAAIASDPRLDVRIVEDPHFLDSAALDRYAAIVLHFMNWKVPAPGTAARQNLRRAVEGGKGLVLVHFACGAWQDWPEFVQLAGRVWDPKLRGHDPRGPFRVEIGPRPHAITAGLAAFETDDELYTCLAGSPAVDVLATARSKVDGSVHPMAFVLSAGKGRVFHCVLGHDAKAFVPEGTKILFRRGTAWAAGLSP